MLISDSDCQPTSLVFMATCSVLGVKQIFTSFCNPKGSSVTGRFFRAQKEKAREFETYAELNEVLTK